MNQELIGSALENKTRGLKWIKYFNQQIEIQKLNKVIQYLKDNEIDLTLNDLESEVLSND